jgi:hypothetical protein
VLINDFEYVHIPKEEFWMGMYTYPEGPEDPKAFELFNFIIEEAPEHEFKVHHIPSDLYFKAALEAGFKNITFTPQYPHPDIADNEVMKRYFDECKPTDFIFKLSL